MEADWNEAARLTNPGTYLTTFCFDPSEDLLWTGSDTVSVPARRCRRCCAPTHSFYDATPLSYTIIHGHTAPT